MVEKQKIGEIQGLGYRSGMEPVYKVGKEVWIPVNTGANWAKKFLTKEDWEKIAEELDKIDEPVKFDLSVGLVKLKLDDHPDGADRGGYVPTLLFKNVRSYYHDNHDKTWQDGREWGISIYYDHIDCEWR